MKLTFEEFKKLPFTEPFACGVTTDDENGANMTGNGQKLKWIAKKGGINDWAIYIHFYHSSWDFVLTNGDKVQSRENIKRLIDVDDETLDSYRH